MKYIANKFIIAHNFIFEIILKILSKYYYKYNIVLLDKIIIFLKSCCVIYCKDLLN